MTEFPPTDTTPAEPDIDDALQETFETLLSRHHGPMPAQVQAYTAGDADSPPLADIQALIAISIDGQVRVPPILREVRIAWRGGGGHSHTFPLQAGDRGLLIPCGGDIDPYLASGTVGAEPQGPRRWSLSDVVFLPDAIYPDPSPPGANTAAADGQVLNVPDGQFCYIGDALVATLAARADKTDARIAAIVAHINGLMVLPGTFVAPAGGGPITGVSGTPSTTLASQATVACDKLKVE